MAPAPVAAMARATAGGQGTRARLQLLFREGSYHVLALAGQGGAVTGAVTGAGILGVSFGSIGHDAGQVPSAEFVGTLRGLGPAIFIQDEARSWANAPGFEAALRRALEWAERAGEGRLRRLFLGQSMGGFAALVAASLVRADVVLAISPQARLDPMGEPRWRDWTGRIDAPRFASAPQPLPGTECWLMHGLVDDLEQALGFAAGPGVSHLMFEGLGHSDLCPHLKARGCLGGLVAALAQGDRRRALRIAAGAGGRLRQRLDQALLRPAGEVAGSGAVRS